MAKYVLKINELDCYVGCDKHAHSTEGINHSVTADIQKARVFGNKTGPILLVKDLRKTRYTFEVIEVKLIEVK